MGRKTSYRKKYLPIILEMARKRNTDREIASALGVPKSTFSDWLQKYPDLSDRLLEAREAPIREVEANFFKRANGFTIQQREIEVDPKDRTTVTSIKVKDRYFPPNVTAATLILTNKLPSEYKNRQSHEISGRVGVKHYIGWSPDSWDRQFPEWPARKQLPGEKGGGGGQAQPALEIVDGGGKGAA